MDVEPLDLLNVDNHITFYKNTSQRDWKIIVHNFQKFLDSEEISHIEKKDVIDNLGNDVIINKNFMRKEKTLSILIQKKQGYNLVIMLLIR